MSCVQVLAREVFHRWVRYLLVLMSFGVVISAGIWAVEEFLVVALRFESRELIWGQVAMRTGATVTGVRVVVYAVIQANFLLMCHRAVISLAQKMDLGTANGEKEDDLSAIMSPLALSVAWAAGLVLALGSVVWVACQSDQEQGFGEVSVRLLGGQAAFELPDAFKRVRGHQGRATIYPGVTLTQYEQVILMSNAEDTALLGSPLGPPELQKPDGQGERPMLDRWDRWIWEAAGGEKRRFAQIKAVMWVESAGRQFAISRTGCAGLMQFCSGTARREPFTEIFGQGQVSSCGCAGTSCRVDSRTKQQMELGDLAVIKALAPGYPCHLSDARFDANKSILAGARYIQDLDEEFGGNLMLIYIGYNSGPMVAREVWRTTGYNPEVELGEIERVLVQALHPYYGSQAGWRAESLVSRHLPKLMRNFEYYDHHAVMPVDAKELVDRTHKTKPSELWTRGNQDEIASVCVDDRLIGEREVSHPIAIPFMEEMALNLSEAATSSQERGGRVEPSWSARRWRQMERPLHQSAKESGWGQYAEVPAIRFDKRALFGFQARDYAYEMNPHTGRFDLLSMVLDAGSTDVRVKWYKLKQLRERIEVFLGDPSERQVLVPRDLVTSPVLTEEWFLDRLYGSELASYTQWQGQDVSVAMDTEGLGDKDFVRLTVWTSTAQAHRSALQARWAHHERLEEPKAGTREEVIVDPVAEVQLPLSPKGVAPTSGSPSKRAPTRSSPGLNDFFGQGSGRSAKEEVKRTMKPRSPLEEYIGDSSAPLKKGAMEIIP